MLTVKQITQTSADLEDVKHLFSQYMQELNEDLCFQHWDEELEDPLLKYGPPKGSLLLAFWNDEPAGCIALTPLAQPGVCEMKRLFVKPEYRQHGIGEELVKIILHDAADKGFTKMVLDTLTRLGAAIRLYERYGFVNTSAYYENPLPGVVYMERGL